LCMWRVPFWTTTVLWLVVVLTGIVVRQATGKDEEGDDRNYPSNPLPTWSRYDTFSFVTLYALVCLHQFFSLLSFRRASGLSLCGMRTEENKWDDNEKAVMRHAILPFILLITWFIIYFGIFESIRKSAVTASNPDGRGSDLSGHLFSMTCSSLTLQAEVFYALPQSRFLNLFLWIGQFIILFSFYEGFITTYIFHTWYESLIGAVTGLVLSLIIYIGIPRKIKWFYRPIFKEYDGTKYILDDDATQGSPLRNHHHPNHSITYPYEIHDIEEQQGLTSGGASHGTIEDDPRTY